MLYRKLICAIALTAFARDEDRHRAVEAGDRAGQLAPGAPRPEQQSRDHADARPDGDVLDPSRANCQRRAHCRIVGRTRR